MEYVGLLYGDDTTPLVKCIETATGDHSHTPTCQLRNTYGIALPKSTVNYTLYILVPSQMVPRCHQGRIQSLSLGGAEPMSSAPPLPSLPPIPPLPCPFPSLPSLLYPSPPSFPSLSPALSSPPFPFPPLPLKRGVRGSSPRKF